MYFLSFPASLFVTIHIVHLDDTLDLQLYLTGPEGNQGFLMGNRPQSCWGHIRLCIPFLSIPEH